MKIQQLFHALEEKSLKENAKAIFDKSGMVNDYAKLKYGFFPLGSGILSDKSKIDEAEISDGGIMVLGNDFGTVKYIDEQCKQNLREPDSSKTILNLMDIGLNLTTTFFTNFYLGLKDDKRYKGVIMTSNKNVTSEYRKFCYEFLLTQINFIRPRLIICLGKPVCTALSHFHKNLFPEFKNRNAQYSEVNDLILGEKAFLFIPHPSGKHYNWTRELSETIKSTIADHQPKRGFGSMKGLIIMKPDFDEPLVDFKEYM